ncbi:MAG: hypothetical protein IJN63_07520 [Clostridia bacterium]|nr:hypothetical protein [Clostridia bacterium]
MGNRFKRCLNGTCTIFTVLVLVFYIFGYYVSIAKQPAMTGGMITALFFASMCFSFSSLCLSVKKIPRPIAYLLHCACCVAAAYLLYVNVLGKGATPSGKMVCIVLTLVIYTVTMLVRGAIISAIEKRKDA